MTVSLKKIRIANQLTNQINRKIEEELKTNLQTFFETLKQKVLIAFDEYYNETFLLQGHINLILAPIHEAEQEYYELLLKYNTMMYERGKKQGLRFASNRLNALKAKKKTVDILPDNDNLFGTIDSSENHLREYTFTASDKTMSRVDEEINSIIADGYRSGAGVKDVRNRILERYDQFSSWEANRIARTEMQTAHNMGVMQSYQELGVEYKEWRSAEDKRVRRSHMYLDGEIVPLDQPFSNGLMFPGDKSGRIGEWINCRCSVLPYLMPPGSSAPPGQLSFRETDLVNVTEPNYGKLLQKETGGALNWQQYKQILHGKTLEQIGTGVIVEATVRGKGSNVKREVNVEEVKQKVEPHITKIADTQKEADLLMDIIPKFRKSTINKKSEEMWLMDNNQKVYHQKKGSNRRVQMPQEAVDEALENGLLISGHNHPYGTCVQSETDLTTLGRARQKYSWTSGDDGIFMIKNNNLDLIDPNQNINDAYNRDQIRLIYKREMKSLDKRFKKEKVSEIQDLERKYRNKEITRKQWLYEHNKIYSNFLSDNANLLSQNCNKKYSEKGLGVEITYIPL